MCSMMSKDADLNDGGGHNKAHLVFYTPLMDGAVWATNPIDDSNHVSFKFPNSPILLTPQFLGNPEPMENFVFPPACGLMELRIRCKEGHLSAASESLSDARA
jgi:hypothetical protein